MARRPSSTPGVFITATGWTGKASAVTAGNEQLHEEVARENVRLMKGGLMARRLKVHGHFRNPYPDGHQGAGRPSLRFDALIDWDELE